MGMLKLVMGKWWQDLLWWREEDRDVSDQKENLAPQKVTLTKISDRPSLTVETWDEFTMCYGEAAPTMHVELEEGGEDYIGPGGSYIHRGGNRRNYFR